MRFSSRYPGAYCIDPANNDRIRQQRTPHFIPCIRDCRECAIYPDNKLYRKTRRPSNLSKDNLSSDNAPCTCCKLLMYGHHGGSRRRFTRKSIRTPLSDKYSSLGKIFFTDKRVQTRNSLASRNAQDIKDFSEESDKVNGPDIHNFAIRCMCTKKLKHKIKCICKNGKKPIKQIRSSKKSLKHYRITSLKYPKKNQGDLISRNTKSDKISSYRRNRMCPKQCRGMGDMNSKSYIGTKIDTRAQLSDEVKQNPAVPSHELTKLPTKKRSKMIDYVSDICTRNKCNRRCRREIDIKPKTPLNCTEINDIRSINRIHKRGCLKLNLGSQQIIVCTCKRIEKPEPPRKTLISKIKSITSCFCSPKKKIVNKKEKENIFFSTQNVCACLAAKCICPKELKKRRKRANRLLKKRRKKEFKKHKKEIKKLAKQSANTMVGSTNCITEGVSGLMLLIFHGIKGVANIFYRIFAKPYESMEYIRARLKEPETSCNYYLKRISAFIEKRKLLMHKSLKGDENMTILDDAVKDTGLFKAFQSSGKSGAEIRATKRENARRARRNEQRHNAALYSCKHILLLTLRNRPCIWVYYICPYLYPQCLSLLSFWRNFTDLLLFGLAILVWTPCIACCELARAFMCCCLCTQ